MELTRPPEGWQKRILRCTSEVAAGAVWSGSKPPSPEPLQLEGAGKLDALATYLDLLLEWNRRLDLTAARGVDELVDLFVADATIVALTTAGVQDWVDVGTGAGAPGLPLRLLRPELDMTLVEPLSKRAAFLRSAIGTFGWSNVRVERVRSEEIAGGAHEVAISRATLAPEQWLREGARIGRSSVWVLLARAEAPELPGWQAEIDVSYQWPLTNAPRRAIRYGKVAVRSCLTLGPRLGEKERL